MVELVGSLQVCRLPDLNPFEYVASNLDTTVPCTGWLIPCSQANKTKQLGIHTVEESATGGTDRWNECGPKAEQRLSRVESD